MFLLIKKAEVYAPEYIGKKDILLCNDKIIKIDNEINVNFEDVKIIDGNGKIAIPGLIDQHVHVTGGGGEGSFKTRVPEVMLSELTKGGVTTVVGLLGTDSTTRCVENLLAKTKALNEEGITAYCLTGAYEYPSPTITGSVKKDITMISEILGVKLALSDHRSSVVNKDELSRIAADARVAGMFSGKTGFVKLHMGGGNKGLKPIYEILEETDIPIAHFRPTHVSRKKELFIEAMDFAKQGGYIDLTAGDSSGYLPMNQLLTMLKDAEVPMKRVTLSSDGKGSWSKYDSEGKLVAIGFSRCDTMHENLKSLVQNHGFKLEDILPLVSTNPAKALNLFPLKGALGAGACGDIVLLDDNLDIDTVIAKGKVMIENKEVVIKGTYEM